MSKQKHPLSTQTTKLFIVIRKNKEISINKIKAYCEDYLSEYAFIEHKNDIEPITGLVEGCHYHIVGQAKKTKTRLSTHLNDIVEFFSFDNADGIQIDKYDSYVKALQYLIHKNNPEKTQHKSDEIISNIETKELTTLLTTECDDMISFDLVYATCNRAHNIVEVIREIGFKTYHRYRATIRDIYEELKKV